MAVKNVQAVKNLQAKSKGQEKSLAGKSTPVIAAAVPVVSATKPNKGTAAKPLPTPTTSAQVSKKPVAATKSNAATKPVAAKPAAPAKAVAAAKPVATKPAAAAKPVATMSATAKSATAKSAAAVKGNSKPAASKLAPAKPATTKLVKPAPSKKVAAALAEKKLREKSAAKREAARSGKPVMAQISSKAPVRHPDSTKLSKNQIAENLRLGAKASKSRMAMSGNVHIKSHVAAANRRSQSRRDGK